MNSPPHLFSQRTQTTYSMTPPSRPDARPGREEVMIKLPAKTTLFAALTRKASGPFGLDGGVIEYDVCVLCNKRCGGEYRTYLSHHCVIDDQKFVDDVADGHFTLISKETTFPQVLRPPSSLRTC